MPHVGESKQMQITPASVISLPRVSSGRPCHASWRACILVLWRSQRLTQVRLYPCSRLAGIVMSAFRVAFVCFRAPRTTLGCSPRVCLAGFVPFHPFCLSRPPHRRAHHREHIEGSHDAAACEECGYGQRERSFCRELIP